MTKNEKELIIIETLPYMQEEERALLRESGKSLGWIVDEGFKEETRALVELMNSLYAVYDDIKAEIEEENNRYVPMDLLADVNGGMISKEQQEKLIKILKDYTPTFDITKSLK